MPRHQYAQRKMVKQWDGISGLQGQNVTASSTVLGARLSFTEASTILRMVGSWSVSPTAGGTFAADDEANITVGLGIVSSDAFEAGAASVPDPNAEPEYPWMYWEQVNVYAFTAPVAGDDLGALQKYRTFDIKSMRKVKPRESLIWVAQYGDISGSPPYTIFMNAVRVLIATH